MAEKEEVMNITKLYRAYSFVDNHRELGRGVFLWFYHLREKPVAPYEDLIEGYTELDEPLKDHVQRDVDELFTDEEAQTLVAYLKKTHGFESFLIEKPVPLRLEDLRDEKTLRIKHDVPEAIYMLSTEPGYNLPFEVWAYYHLWGDWEAEKPGSSDIISIGEEKIVRLAKQIFAAFPLLVTGLKFYVLDCGCIYYQRKFVDGTVVSTIGIYRDAANGPCEVCMARDKNWRDRVIDETVVYNFGVEAR
jgi:hypothetical protein